MGRDPNVADPEPPVFLRAAAHPVRWRLLNALARGDRQVHELTALVGEQQSLVSYHLGLLRRAELVRTRRSSADGRDIYYRLDLARCGELLSAAGAALNPGLRLVPPPDPPPTDAFRLRPATARSTRVLFLCTGNSSRSQMAEALLARRSGGRVTTFSAGSRPKPIHPHAVTTMAAYGIDLSAARPKHLDEFAGQHFGWVITLCDRIREVCPDFPGGPTAAHWSIPDPAADPDGLPAFDRVAADIAGRVDFLSHTIATEPAREAS
ncbi:metalloregulator ArsR/SmtB family transcription factor [Actinoplanes solisilvae]|uniref:metalloregulator ArsR/SmtB family transcription factor n=1 Tax=Actinoplanes solisilvae TaxID=2486853 RepID=UPI000FD7C5AC|nr:metalloregulator ArsR/SmtB family transcription factor [Actinoplanes solisilvae]